MSGRDDGGEGIRTWIRGVLVVVIIAGALGVFGSMSTLEKPKLSLLNIAGIAIMFIGLLTSMMSPTLAQKAGEDRRSKVATILRIGGMLVCFAGAIMVFI